MFKLKTKDIQESVTLKNLPTLRQAFVVASILIFVGLGLGYYLHQGFLLLPLLVGGGLLFSGVFGFCPMVHILQIMPWNKRD